MRVLVTGGAGYIGSHLVDALLADGHDAVVIDNLSTGTMGNLQHVLDNARFEFVYGTILDSLLVDRLVAGVELVYHLAAVVGVKHVLEDPLGCVRVNVRGTEAILGAAHRHAVRTVVASSSEVYGKSTAIPLGEEDDCLLGPTTAPRWSYALAKAIDEHLALGYGRQGLPVSVVRYFNSYGPRIDPRGYGSVVARFMTQAIRGEPLTVYGDGRQTRCFTYVDDTVRGTILAGTLPEALGQVFNIGSDRETSVGELAILIRDAVGSASPIEHVPFEQAFGASFEESARRVPDVSRAARVLGFRAGVDLEQGLARTLAWFREPARPAESG